MEIRAAQPCASLPQAAPPPNLGLASLRAEYAALGQQALKLAQDGSVRFPEIRRALTEATRHGRMAFLALQRTRETDEESPSSTVAATLLARYAQELDAVGRRVADLRRLDSYLLELRHLHAELVHSGRSRCFLVRGLARRISFDLLESAEGRFSISTPSAVRQEPGGWLASAIQTARTLVRMAHLSGFPQPRIELLASAALLNDLGLTFWSEVRGIPPQELRRDHREDFLRHPRLSAALAAGMDDAPGALPALIAHHHESLDGSGYPDRLRKWSCSSDDRLVQAAVRFVELEAAQSSESDEDVPPQQRAAARLWDESQRGRWDERATRHLLRSLAMDGAADGELRTRMVEGDSRTRQWRKDERHEGVPAPHELPATERAAPSPHFSFERTENVRQPSQAAAGRR